MNAKLLTDVELRARWRRGDMAYAVEEGTILTPAAQDFVREHDVTLTFFPKCARAERMTRECFPDSESQVQYQDAETGAALLCKPEAMTHLRGRLLVSKTHPRIRLRGCLDTLTAQFLTVELTADELGKRQVVEALEELLEYLRHILAAEVKEQPLEKIRFDGLDSAAIRRVSHHVREEIGIDHPIPDYRMGRLCVELNLLRTQVRKTELVAADAFVDMSGKCTRTDIVEGLNRLSSCVYILFCRVLAGKYNQEKRNELL